MRNKIGDIQVAADAKDRSFVAAPACVEAMYNIWYDKIHPNQSRKVDRLTLFLGLISLGLLAPPLVSYREYNQVISKIFSNGFISIFLRQPLVKLQNQCTYTEEKDPHGLIDVPFCSFQFKIMWYQLL